MAGYLLELSQVREMLDGRYDDLKSGRAKPMLTVAIARLRQILPSAGSRGYRRRSASVITKPKAVR